MVPTARRDAERGLRAYFERAGYKPKDRRPLSFSRGSTLGTYIGLSPKSWKVDASVTIRAADDGLDVSVHLEIDSSGQIVTPKEDEFWRIEADGIEVAMRQPNALHSSHKANETARTGNLNIIVTVIVVAIMAGVVVGFLAFLAS